MTIGINYAFTDFGQRAVRNPFPPNAIELLNISNTPRHAYSASFDYDFGTTGIGRPRIHIDADNVGGSYSSGAPSSDPTLSARKWLINGRLSISKIPVLGDAFEIAVWAKNLTNRTYQQFDIIVPTGAGNNFTTFYNEPRSFGVELRARF